MAKAACSAQNDGKSDMQRVLITFKARCCTAVPLLLNMLREKPTFASASTFLLAFMATVKDGAQAVTHDIKRIFVVRFGYSIAVTLYIDAV